MDEYFMQQLCAELIDANEQAFAVFAGAIADLNPGFGPALAARMAKAQAAIVHPTRDRLLKTALQAATSR